MIKMQEYVEDEAARQREDMIVYWSWVAKGKWTIALRAEELFQITILSKRKKKERNLVFNFNLKETI